MQRLTIIAVAIAGLAACGHPASTESPGNRDDDLPGDRVADPPPDTRTEIEKRRDAACETLGPRLTDCAIADARATMSAEELAKLDIEKTAPVHTQKFVEQCKGQSLSSRQVRVYEVCLREETACDALVSCLDNVRPEAAAP